ncbi:MAG: hypothetical protein EOM25_07720 [Deltaproteobacteria bacterium]|nr:hypothetical protein [Deltaproteobacteria bacterium]
MIRRFCDICGKEIRTKAEGLYAGQYVLEIKDPANLSRLGGKSTSQDPTISLALADCHHQDICVFCLQKVLAQEFSALNRRLDSRGPAEEG